MTTAYDDLRESQEEVQRLQRALAFWLPSVPTDGAQQVIDRITHDAFLLTGYEPEEDEPDAETLGWIELMPQIEEVKP